MTKIFDKETKIINEASDPVPVSSSSPMASAIYEDGDIMYICKAPLGSELSAAVWQIQRFDSGSSPMQTLWCDGDALFNNTATDLATVQGHSYS